MDDATAAHPPAAASLDLRLEHSGGSEGGIHAEQRRLRRRRQIPRTQSGREYQARVAICSPLEPLGSLLRTGESTCAPVTLMRSRSSRLTPEWWLFQDDCEHPSDDARLLARELPKSE